MKVLCRLFRLILLVATGVAVWFGYHYFQSQKQWIDQQNAAVTLMNDGEYEAAAKTLERLIADIQEDDMHGLGQRHLGRVESLLAQCLVAVADEDYGASLNENLARYRRAYDLDPDSVDDPMILRLLQRDGGG